MLLLFLVSIELCFIIIWTIVILHKICITNKRLKEYERIIKDVKSTSKIPKEL
jgi:hypothetical protein